MCTKLLGRDLLDVGIRQLLAGADIPEEALEEAEAAYLLRRVAAEEECVVNKLRAWAAYSLGLIRFERPRISEVEWQHGTFMLTNWTVTIQRMPLVGSFVFADATPENLALADQLKNAFEEQPDEPIVVLEKSGKSG